MDSVQTAMWLAVVLLICLAGCTRSIEEISQNADQSFWWPQETSAKTPHTEKSFNPPFSHFTQEVSGGANSQGSWQDAPAPEPTLPENAQPPSNLQQSLSRNVKAESPSWWPGETSITALHPAQQPSPTTKDALDPTNPLASPPIPSASVFKNMEPDGQKPETQTLNTSPKVYVSSTPMPIIPEKFNANFQENWVENNGPFSFLNSPHNDLLVKEEKHSKITNKEIQPESAPFIFDSINTINHIINHTSDKSHSNAEVQPLFKKATSHRPDSEIIWSSPWSSSAANELGLETEKKSEIEKKSTGNDIKGFPQESEVIISIPSATPHGLSMKNEITSRPQERESGWSKIVGTSQPLPTNIDMDYTSELMTNKSQPESDISTSIFSTRSHDVRTSIETTRRPQVRGSGRSPFLGTSQPLPPTTSKNIYVDYPSQLVTGKSQPDSDIQTSISYTTPYDTPVTTETTEEILQLPSQSSDFANSLLTSASISIRTSESGTKVVDADFKNSSSLTPSKQFNVPKSNETINHSQVNEGSSRSPITVKDFTKLNSSSFPNDQEVPLSNIREAIPEEGYYFQYDVSSHNTTKDQTERSNSKKLKNKKITSPPNLGVELNKERLAPTFRGRVRSIISDIPLNKPTEYLYNKEMSKVTSSFVPLPPLRRPSVDLGSQMPVEQVVVEDDDNYNVNDLKTLDPYLVHKPIDHQSAISEDNNNTVLVKEELNKDISKEEDLKSQINLNENEIQKEVSPPNSHHKHHYNKNSLKPEMDLSSNDGKSHYHRATRKHHGHKHHHHSRSKSHHGVKENVDDSNNNNNPSNMIPDSTELSNSYHYVPEIAYYLYHSSNDLVYDEYIPSMEY